MTFTYYMTLLAGRICHDFTVEPEIEQFHADRNAISSDSIPGNSDRSGISKPRPKTATDLSPRTAFLSRREAHL
jgi:hypothetical protein